MSPVILGTAAAGLLCIERFDQKIVPGRKEAAAAVAAGLAGSVLLRWSLGPGEIFPRLLLSVVVGCLLLASLTDAATCRVYNFVWWPAGAAALALFGCGGPEGFWLLIRTVPEMLIFCTVQIRLFGKLYGRADCYAFCVCAAAEAGLGMKFGDFLIQACRKNISRKGQLKEPVAFVPYITAGFYLTIIFHKICGETVVPLS